MAGLFSVQKIHLFLREAETNQSKMEKFESNVATINDMNSMIATAIEQQTAVMNNVNEHVHEVRNLSEESKSLSSKGLDLSKELNAISNTLTNSLSHLKI
ncbi:methyl-accepting chemotaxis protein [Pleionea sediminis]|uniref:methyl-accepting chemotaxis protein n=1 Tax=Pleionea sediminis TaxID=2569479 RepID=UPI001186AFFC|nr:methyl-accepting chemotaxis protein [Pleionea sediminis]